MEDIEVEDIYGTYGEEPIENEDVDFGTIEDEGFGDGEGVAMEEAEYTATFEQLQNLRYGETTGELVEGISKGIQRALRTPEENAKTQMQIFLTSSRFEKLQESRIQAIISMAEKLKNMALLNTEVLTFAALWKLEGYELNKKDMQSFVAKYKIPTENQVDIVRYLRILNLK
jgi:hypothetical protein